MTKSNYLLLYLALACCLSKCTCEDYPINGHNSNVIPGFSYVTFDCDTLKKYNDRTRVDFNNFFHGVGDKIMSQRHLKFGTLYYLAPAFRLGILEPGINKLPVIFTKAGDTYVIERIDTLTVTAEYFENTFRNPSTLELRYTKVLYNNKEVPKYTYTGDGGEAYIYILPGGKVASGNCSVN